MEKVEVYFEKQLERTNYWLSFAEAKNAVIVALNIAFIAAWKQMFGNYSLLHLTIILLFASSMIIGITSFFPRLSLLPENEISTGIHSVENSNMIFMGEISKIKSPDNYVAVVLKKYFNGSVNNKQISPMIHDLAEEIIINSGITIRKLFLFKISLFFDLAAFVLYIIAVILEQCSWC